MFEIGEIVVYRNEVYRIIKRIKDLSRQEDYFVLEPYHSVEGIITQVKILCNRGNGVLRKLSTKRLNTQMNVILFRLMNI